MLLTRRSLFRLAVVSALSPLIAFAQVPAPPATSDGSACIPMANIAIPSRAAIEAKVTGLDSTHLKAGKEIWFKIARPFYYPGCALDAGSVVYAQIVSVSRSVISLNFDGADCNHRDHQPLRLKIIAIVAPPGESHHMHEDMPTEVAGGVRQIGEAVFATNEYDEDLNPGGPPHTIRPGIVVGIKNLKLEPTAGPQCSDKISTEARKVQLAPGSALILAMTVTRNIKKPQHEPAPAHHP